MAIAGCGKDKLQLQHVYHCTLSWARFPCGRLRSHLHPVVWLQLQLQLAAGFRPAARIPTTSRELSIPGNTTMGWRRSTARTRSRSTTSTTCPAFRWKNAIVSGVLDRWELSGITIFQSGAPTGATLTTTNGVSVAKPASC